MGAANGTEIRRRPARARLLPGLGLLLLAIGCTSTPSLEPDFLGLTQGLREPIETRVLANADVLPKLSADPWESHYKIGVLDELIVTVWGHPDLGSQIPLERDSRRNVSIVQENGTIGLPFLGDVNVLGLTTEQARVYIEELYDAIVEGAQVDVVVVTFRSKTVLLEGEFQQEGRLNLSQDVRTVGDAVNQAGGLTPLAETSLGILIRDGIEYRLDYRASQEGRSDVHDVLLWDGDKIYFPRLDERLVYVFGEVPRQGAIPIPPKGLTVVEALAISGGPNVITANVQKIYLLRNTSARSEVYQFTLAEALEAPDIALRPGDRMYLPPTLVAQWDRFWRQALPFFATTSAAAITRRNVVLDER